MLNLPEPWPTAARKLYAEMISLEWEDTSKHRCDEGILEDIEKLAFGKLIFTGIQPETAREKASSIAREAVRELRPTSEGRRERDRRRAFREAVTGSDGATAVTTGLVEACIGAAVLFPRKGGGVPATMRPTVATHAVRLHTESGFRRSAEAFSLFLPPRGGRLWLLSGADLFQFVLRESGKPTTFVPATDIRR